MKIFLSRILLFIFIAGTYPVNANVCHSENDQALDNVHQQELSDCHQANADTRKDIKKDTDKNCCNSDCTACFHANAFVTNLIINPIVHINFKTFYISINPTSYFPDVSTPPPTV